jgi:hypothetical protein
MPEYDATRFSPPAPVARITLRNPQTNAELADQLLLIDTGRQAGGPTSREPIHLHAGPTGRPLIARGVSPWNNRRREIKSPNGATVTAAPLGLARSNCSSLPGASAAWLLTIAALRQNPKLAHDRASRELGDPVSQSNRFILRTRNRRTDSQLTNSINLSFRACHRWVIRLK